MMGERQQHDTDSLAAFVAQGLTLSEISEETGTSVAAVRRALARRGLRATHSLAVTIRKRAESMRPTQAVEYLLDQLDLLTDGHASGAEHPVDHAVPNLTPNQRRILMALWDAKGAVLTKEAILSAMTFGRSGDEPEIKVVDVQICKMRKKLPTELAIRTVWGRGFRLTRSASQEVGIAA